MLGYYHPKVDGLKTRRQKNIFSRSTAAFLENFLCQGPLDIPDPIVYTGDPKAYDKCYWMVGIDSDSYFT